MPWNNQGGGGGWQGPGGGGGGPWGRGPSGGGGGGQPPDLEDLIKRFQDRGRRFLPGGFGGARGIALIVAALVVVWLLTGFYRVHPDQQGVPLVFGRWSGTTTEQGLNYNWPAPIGEVFTPKVTQIEHTDVGFRSTSTGATRDQPDEALMLTGDENIIDVQYTVFWRIKDAGQYLFNIRDPQTVVTDVAESAMRQVIGQTQLATALAEGRGKVEQETQVLMQQILDHVGSGVEVTQVEMQKVDPPDQVIDAFRDVQAARADQESEINQAQAYQNKVVPIARGEAQQIIQQAEGYKQQVVNNAEGDAARFLSVYQQYVNAKDVTRRRIYLETMESVLSGMNKIVVEDNASGSGGVLPYLPLDQLKPMPKPPAGGSDTGAGSVSGSSNTGQP
jgi:membrane protease subunit HflK